MTKAERDKLRRILQQAMNDADVPGQISEQVRSEIARYTREAPGGTGYLERIGAASEAGRTPRGNKLPPAARLFARLGLIAGLGNGDRTTERELARSLDVEAQYKEAQSAGSAEGGGLLLADQTASDVIELLRPFSAVRQIGARSIDIPVGSLRTPKITSGVTSGYVGEGQAIPASQAKTGSIQLTAKKLATLVVLTNELRSFGAGMIDAILLDDMLASIGSTEDRAFLFGQGTENEPRGITVWAANANKFDATQAGGAATLTEVRTDLRKAEEALLSGDVPMRLPVWIMSPRSRLFLRDVRDTEDRTVYGTEMAQSGTINGHRFVETNNIPNNLGAGEDESLVILVDATEVVIGDVQQIAVDRSSDAPVNIDGTNTSLFQHDMSGIRVRQWNDLMLRHAASASVIEAVRWGA